MTPQSKYPFERLSCTEHLIKVANESKDPIIQKKAKLLLTNRFRLKETKTF